MWLHSIFDPIQLVMKCSGKLFLKLLSQNFSTCACVSIDTIIINAAHARKEIKIEINKIYDSQQRVIKRLIFLLLPKSYFSIVMMTRCRNYPLMAHRENVCRWCFPWRKKYLWERKVMKLIKLFNHKIYKRWWRA